VKGFVIAILLGTAIAVAADATTPTNFTVTPVGLSFWNVNGSNNPPLTLTRGKTYIFNVSALGHVFAIKTAPTIGSTNRYSDGVTNNGISSGAVTFVVPANAPATLFYQCEIHSPMSGTLNIVDRGAPGLMPVGVGLLAIAIGAFGVRALRRRTA
jgi:hypothetical protein